MLNELYVKKNNGPRVAPQMLIGAMGRQMSDASEGFQIKC